LLQTYKEDSKMKSHLRLVLLAALVVLCPLQGRSQDKPSAAETVDNLKLQLIDVKAREDNLKLRVQRLDEDLKPENIERALAGVGSTRPEELREQRRRQLTIEKTAVVAQLEETAALRSRLETDLAAAEVEAYQQSAKGNTVQNKMLVSQSPIAFRWLLLAALVVVAGIGVSIMLVLRLRVSGGRSDS
jgi:ribosomal protein S7